MDTDQLRAYCMSMPGAHEGIKWEDHLCFMVAEKMFCLTGFTDDSRVNFKIDPEEFDILADRDGIEQAPHFARRQWISIVRRSALKRSEWEEYLLKSYELVKAKLPKKIQKEIDELK